MKFYKLELIKREHSYNNMFGNNPNVGTLNPMGAMGAMKVAAPMVPTKSQKPPTNNMRSAKNF